MAKELPYFKFEPNQWENGNVQLCTREGKGLFIDLCSVYWSRLGDLSYKLAVQKVCGGNATALDSLINEGVIQNIDGAICIDFLNEQLHEFDNTSKTNSENARSGWEKRRKHATASKSHSESDAIRGEKIREEEKREEETLVIVWPTFDDFWDKYEKKQDKPKCFKKWGKIKQAEREKIMRHLDGYIPATPDITYRKNPLTYLNNESWENEIIIKSNGTTKDKSTAHLTGLVEGYKQRHSGTDKGG